MWAKVDDGWWCHPKVMGLNTGARGLWVSALSWSCAQRQDTVPFAFLPVANGSNDEANALVDAGLWELVDDGWRIHDWDDYQQKSLSEKRAEAGHKGGKASGKSKQRGSKEEAKDEAGTRPVPSRPVPSKTPSRASRKSQAPDTFTVTDELYHWAQSTGLDIDLEFETEKFLDYHGAKGNKFADWTRAWRNWMRNAQTFTDRDNPTKQKQIEI